MKRLIIGGLSVLLMSAATAPALRAQTSTLGTPLSPAVNPAADPGSRLAPGTPGAPAVDNDTVPLETPTAGSKGSTTQETTPAGSLGTLGTPLFPAANPAADPGSRLAPGTPGAPDLD